MKLRRLSLKITIAAGFSAVIILSGIIALTTYFSMIKMQNTLSAFNKLEQQEKYISDFLVYYLESQLALNSMLTIDLGTEEADFRTAVLSMKTAASHLESSIHSIMKMTNDYSDTIESIIKSRKAESAAADPASAAAIRSLNESNGRNLSLINYNAITALENAGSAISLEMEINTAEQNKLMKSFLIQISTAFLVLIAAGLLIAFFTARAVVVPVSTLIKSISAISKGDGDLTKRVKLTSHNEMGILGKNVNTFISRVHDIIYRMKGVSNESRKIGEKLAAKSSDIGAVVEQMGAAMENLKKNGGLLNNDVLNVKQEVQEIENLLENIVTRIEEQSSAVNESSAAVEEMIASVTNISSIAESKQGIIKQLETTAKRSETDMEETLRVITGIASSADLISDLIQVINDVADRTNLLAMNAAIEAAHAGDAGRGFAVVADEIRKLAETTSSNARGIASNLALIIGNIQNSAKLTQSMGISINDMTGSIGDVASSMNEMTGGLQELAAGTSQVTDALNSMVSITADVRNSSITIREKSSNIEKSMVNLGNLSGQNSASLEETSAGINEITGAVNVVSALGSRNTENLKIMDNEIELFKTIDVSSLKSKDGQALIISESSRKKIPPRPENPELLPETNPGRWWDMEYGGWKVGKLPMPESEADGADGKKIVALVPDSCNPYFEAYCRGMQKYAEQFKLNLEILSAENDPGKQRMQLSNLLKRKPDLLIYTPADVKESTEWLKKLYNRNIPVITGSWMPEMDGYKYVVSATGPDLWGQARILARGFSNLMNKTGEYCIASTEPGSETFFAKSYGIITELSAAAPGMKCLDIFDNGGDKEALRTRAAEWAAGYGSRVKGLVLGNDLFQEVVIDEFKKAGCRPEVIAAFGNSEAGITGIRSGTLDVETMQSAESAGALPLETAFEYFNGLKPEPIKYLPKRIITLKNVESYFPAQW